MDIFKRNVGALSAEEQKSLSEKKVFIAGCGGLGGFNAEFCTRIGIGEITLCDKDVFDVTNLNRQRFSDIFSIGKNKAEIAREKLLDVNPTAKITAVVDEIKDGNAAELMDGCDVVIDALDNVETRLCLERAAEKCGLPMIFGAVGGWCGQVSAVYPGDNTVAKLYKNSATEEKPSVTVMAAAVTAAYQSAEAVNVLLGRPSLKKKLLIVDLREMESYVLNV